MDNSRESFNCSSSQQFQLHIDYSFTFSTAWRQRRVLKVSIYSLRQEGDIWSPEDWKNKLYHPQVSSAKWEIISQHLLGKAITEALHKSETYLSVAKRIQSGILWQTQHIIVALELGNTNSGFNPVCVPAFTVTNCIILPRFVGDAI